MGICATRARPGIDPDEALVLAASLARHSLHPASRAIAVAAGNAGWPVSEVAEQAGRGVAGVLAVPGAASRRLRLGSASFCGAPAAAAPAQQPVVHLADDAGWLASFELDESLRAEAAAAVAALRRQGLQVQLLSGDAAPAVQRLARRAGIADAHGDCSPEDKLDRVRRAQAAGRRVAMVGDGVNDGPVLARADVSIAMGDAVPLAQAKSDFIVLGGHLLAGATLVAQSRRTQRIVRQNLAWAAGYNAVCVPLAVVGWMPPWLAGLGMAASSLLVVANAARLARVAGAGAVEDAAVGPAPLAGQSA
jgi:Cu2+-exporting ATPase